MDIGYQGPQRSLTSPNWPSSLANEKKVTHFIQEQIELGGVAGPWDHPPLDFFVASPLSAVPKRNSAKIRVIHDLSWPPGTSCNDGIDPYDYSLSYLKFDDIIGKIQSFKKPCWLAKQDLKAAFTQIIAQPKCWNQVGFKWHANYYIYTCLSFGLRSAPKLFNNYAEALLYMAIKNGTNDLTDHFLDDYITFEATHADCDKSIDCLAITTEDTGFERKLSKYTSAAQEMEVLSLVINTVNKVIKVPPDKLSDIFSLLEEFTNKEFTKR